MIDTSLLEILNKDLALQSNDENISEDELLLMIEDRVKYFLTHEKEMMVSYLYRLDVPQSQVNAAMRLTNIIPPEKSLALLIYKRQLERIATKQKYKQSPIDGWSF